MVKSVIRPAGEGEALSVVGERIRVLADSAMTDGKCFIFENISAPGNGPPLHRHGREDEMFYVVEGTVKFSVDGVESVVTAGGSAIAPRGSVHAFANIGDTPSRMIVTCCPGGLETAFRECDQLARAGGETPAAVTEAFKRIDLEIVSPPLSIK